MSEFDFKQSIFIQHRGKPSDQFNYVYPEAQVWVSFSYRSWMKVFFNARVNKVYSDLDDSKLIQKDSLIMAYFLMTDGAVAYKAFKSSGTPYIVSVRNSDINHYLKYRRWLKPLARKILSNAKFIIFASPSYLEIAKEIFGEIFFNEIIFPKARIIGNIINPSWFSGISQKTSPVDKIRLIYMGEFSKNKRLKSLIRAFDILDEKIDLTLTLVGNYGDDCKEILRMASHRPGIKVIDKIDDTSKLIELIDTHDIFAMPSKTETFGMAYIEAMSRGLPVIYSKGQGIDGFFPDGFVGYSVSKPLVKSIVERVLDIVKNYDTLSVQAQISSKKFDKPSILKHYSKMFSSIK